MQLTVVLTVLAALAPLVVSTSLGSGSCKNNEFWYSDRSCCLPHGGITSPPPPPKGSQCPPTSHYWNNKQGCCVPSHPPPPDCPPPQCNKGWEWVPTIHQCKPIVTPPAPPPSKPSNSPGNGYPYGSNNYNHNNNNNHNNHNNHYRRTAQKSRSSPCPEGLNACPASGLTGGYDCLDTSSELESCGGCTTLKQGQDCTAIADAWNVGCDRGKCVVYNCAGGFKMGSDGKSCVPA